MKVNEASIFSIVLAVLVGGFVILSFSLSAYAKTIPLLVGIPIMFLTGVQILIDLKHKGDEKQGPSVGADLVYRRFKQDKPASKRKNDTGPSEASVEQETEKRVRKQEIEMFSWLAGFFLLIFFVGYIAAIPVFCVFFLKLHAKAAWLRTIILTAVITATIHILFIVSLEVPLWRGLFFGGVGF